MHRTKLQIVVTSAVALVAMVFMATASQADTRVTIRAVLSNAFQTVRLEVMLSGATDAVLTGQGIVTPPPCTGDIGASVINCTFGAIFSFGSGDLVFGGGTVQQSSVPGEVGFPVSFAADVSTGQVRLFYQGDACGAFGGGVVEVRRQP